MISLKVLDLPDEAQATARSPVRANWVNSLTDSPWMPSFSMVRPRRQ